MPSRRYALPLLLTFAILAFSPLLLAEAGPAKQPAKELQTKAVTIETPDFLKPPAGLDPKTFTIAKTAPKVDVSFFAGLENRGKGTLWSSWGDGCVASNGKYYTSVGDHLGADATSYVYEYDSVQAVLRRVVDVLQAIAQMLGLYGHGKIHGGIHEGADGKLYFATYWGKPKEVEAAFAKGFPGSVLLSYDPKTGKTENLGAPVPKQGLPASHFDPARQLLYFHAVYKGDVAVYDLKARKVKFHGGADQSAARRTFLADASGRVYFSGPGGGLNFYDPDSNSIKSAKVKLPGSAGAKKKDDTLRAASRPTKAGIVHGMTAAGKLFAFDPKAETVTDLGPNWAGGDYTAVMALSPDERFLYYAPGAHGSGNRSGVPVVQYDIQKKERKVLAFLREPLREKLKWEAGGTYNLQVDPSGERIYITFNGSDPGQRSPFGKPAVVVLHVPKSER